MLLGLSLSLLGQLSRYLFDPTESIDLSAMRLPGVLQRIALIYMVGSLLVIHVGLRGQIVLATVILLGYWALFGWLPNERDYHANLSPEGNVVRVVDRFVLGDAHMYTHAKKEKTDPEGLLSTLPAIVTTLLGYWVGLLIQSRKQDMATALLLIGSGIICAGLGLLWDLAFPINKKIWTSSYVLLSSGLAMVSFAICLLIFDIKGWRRLARPFELVGINAIFAFVASGIFARLLAIVYISDVTVKAWLNEKVLTSLFDNLQLASLAYAVAVVSLWWIILWVMARKGWTIRV